MPISSFTINPAQDGVYVAYRPIIISVLASRTDGQPIPPVVYCDVYFNGVYYKSFSRTVWKRIDTSSSEWEFDIQDAAQEYLKKVLPAFNGTAVEVAQKAFTKCFCRLRSSGLDIDGFVTTENVAPVQGTATSYPINGTGTQTNTFNILNATLQHEDIQQVNSEMNTYKTGAWATDSFPLTKRPNIVLMNKNCSDHFPAFITTVVKKIKLFFKYFGQNTFHTREVSINSGCTIIINTPMFVRDASGYAVVWNVLLGTAESFKVSVNGTAAVSTTSTSYLIGTLGVGMHTVTVTPVCVGGTDSPTVTAQLQVLPEYVNNPGDSEEGGGSGGDCLQLQLNGGTPIPTGALNNEFYRMIYLYGTFPYALESIVKPSWMTIEIVTGQLGAPTILISGTPTSTATGVQVSFKATNCHEIDYSFNQLIDVIDAGTCTAEVTGITFEDGIADKLTWTNTGTPTKYLLKHLRPDGQVYSSETTSNSRQFFFPLVSGEIVTIIPVCTVSGADAKGISKSITIP